ncbi:hypothetical protein [Ktedonobacter robiniae]|uniref:Uncharacterized protein n=1 Tax=Ktedonobacter robiniae TaxID=2778365 RepID=A0ABQ3US71_9CHLR|nr:hypothetical protein [Ktedonobacter robiniae]GHO55537.1 hypothetical protein KSB_40120 [Ktedonobacter robiniae]
MNGDDTFQKSAIEGFIKTQDNLVEAPGEYDLAYRWKDGPIALGFKDLGEDIYQLVYITDEIDNQWEDWMN